ncbi:hypothetical protein ACKWTF_009975 [Chironomus riparius]
MSDEENPATPIRSNSTKRKQNKSLTEPQLSPDLGNKPKVIKMAQYADKNDIQELKQLIATNTVTLNNSITTLNNNIIMLKNDITALKTNMQDITSRIEVIEGSKMSESQILIDTAAEINALNQMKLESQLSILNIPLEIDSKQALEWISKWSKIELNDNNIKRAGIVKPKGKNSAILQLDFYDLAVKHKLMREVKCAQKDKDKKYIPILCEQIFNISPSNVARGQELNFREPFTELNRNLFNTARKHRNIFSNVWVSRGFIMVKQEQGENIKVKSMQQLNLLINTLKNPTSMEH